MSVVVFALLLTVCLGCPLNAVFKDRIDRDLAHFSTGIPPSMIQRAKKVSYTCFFRIINQTLEGKQCELPYNKLFQLIAKELPDMEIVINPLDQPRMLKKNCSNKNWKTCSCDPNYKFPEHSYFYRQCQLNHVNEILPIFSPTTITQCYSDILIPSHVHLLTDTKIKALKETPWKEKQFKAIWRGSNTAGPCKENRRGNSSQSVSSLTKQSPFWIYHRMRFIDFCNHTKACDAKFSTYFSCDPSYCNSLIERYGNASFVSMEDQLKYKILVDIDGNTYSGRFTTLLASGSAVFKIFAFEDIGTLIAKPWVHYVPVKMDLSDFKQKLKWAKENDDQLQQIAIRAKELIHQRSTFQDYKCYYITLLKKYHSLLVTQEVYRDNQAKRKMKNLTTP